MGVTSMKTPEDEAFEDIERRQGGGFPAKRAMAADKLQEPAQEPTKELQCQELEAWANSVWEARATLPQRPWVGLTDEEIAQGNKESWVTEQAWQSAVWWAEAKLKEKNT
jgi:hypothetical protein